MSGLILPEHILREQARRRGQAQLDKMLDAFSQMPLGRGERGVLDSMKIAPMKDPTGVADPVPSPPADDA